MIRLLSAALVLLALPASADTWSEIMPEEPGRAYYATVSGGARLQLGCFNGGRALNFLLIGSPGDTTEANGGEVVIEDVRGETVRLPFVPDVLGPSRNAIVGTLEMDEAALTSFADGLRFRVLNADGAVLFSSGMRGTSAARDDFAATCGL